MLEIYDSPSGYRGVKTWEIGRGSGSEKGSPRPRRATSNDSPTRASSEPKKTSRGESWAPGGQAAPAIIAFLNCNAVRYGATGTFSQQNF